MRALAATDSTEYLKMVARRGLEAVLDDLSVLGRAALEREQELMAWTRLAVDMMDLPFWQSVAALRDREVFSGDVTGVTGLFLENHVMWAQGILIRVVIPMLREGGNR